MDVFPVEQTRTLLHIIDGSLAFAGHYVHEDSHPIHTHSFVEIAVVMGGEGAQRSLAGRKQLEVGDVLMLRPGVWHGYEDCRGLDLYNCGFSTELLRRELAWTREDPLLGFLLWAGPYSSPGRGVLTISLSPSTVAECVVHLDALAAYGTGRPRCTGPTSSAACRSCSASSARPPSRTAACHPGNRGRRTPPSCGRWACSRPTSPATGR